MQEIKSKKPAKENTPEETWSFRWGYIIVPLVILSLSAIVTAYFYHQLPDRVAYNFKLDETPDRWLNREIITTLALVPQFLFTLLAGGITWGITRLSIPSTQMKDVRLKPRTLLMFMGNMVAFPQMILFFAMLDIFSYNSYQIHIMPMWIFLFIILGVATIVLGILLTLIIRKQHNI